MPKASRVGKFRAASRASSRDVRSAPLTSSSHQQGRGKKDDDVAGGGEASTTANKTTTSGGDHATTDDVPPLPREDDGVVDGVAPLSRGQRKRLAKREQYLKRENMVMSSLRLRRLDEQVGKLDGLDAIREALRDASSSSSSSAPPPPLPTPSSSSRNTNRSRKALADAEISHMGLVLGHPAFIDDPFSAIRQHLRNTLADDAVTLRTTSQARILADGTSLARKREERKERQREAKFANNKRRGKNGRASRFGPPLGR
jgi:hypothetical protein